MTEQERLEALIAYSASDNRICPNPMKWNQLWLLFACPIQAVGPPLILSGWAFSSDRDKRTRFKEHLEYALNARLLEEAEVFVRGLGQSEWHSGNESHLDWSYGEALAEDVARYQRATTEAADLLRSPSAPKKLVSLGPQGFSEVMFMYRLALGREDPRAVSAALRRLIEGFAALIDDGESCILNGVNANVMSELLSIQKARRRELLVAEFLICAENSGKLVDRDTIEDFTADVFDVLKE